jgi:hypothetical protein
MNVGADTYAGVYTIPLSAATETQKPGGKKKREDVQR